MQFKFTPKKLLQYFLQGLIILAPIAITIWAITGIFNFVDNILPNLVEALAPNMLPHDAAGKPQHIPGTGLILVLLAVIVVGYVSSLFIVSRLVEIFDKVLERTPGVKIIYSTVKDFFEAFAGNKRKFDRAVLVCIDAEDIWRTGFITQDDVQQFGLAEHVAVYVPQSYAFSGNLYFVKKDRIRPLTDISSADAMKFAISGGVTDIDDDHSLTESNPQA